MELIYDQRPLLLVGVYGPSDKDDDAFWESLIDEVELMGYENTVIIGDCNFVTNIDLDWLNHTAKSNSNPKTAHLGLYHRHNFSISF